MPSDIAPGPVSTRSISTRLACCCALSLAGSSGEGAREKLTPRDELRILAGEALDRGLRQLQIAGDIDDVQRDGAGGRCAPCP